MSLLPSASMPNMVRDYLRAQDYFWRAISNHCLSWKNSAFAYKTGCVGLNFLYITKETPDFEEILNTGEDFFNSHGLTFDLTLPEHFLTPYIQKILKEESYESQGKTVAMVLELEAFFTAAPSPESLEDSQSKIHGSENLYISNFQAPQSRIHLHQNSSTSDFEDHQSRFHGQKSPSAPDFLGANPTLGDDPAISHPVHGSEFKKLPPSGQGLAIFGPRAACAIPMAFENVLFSEKTILSENASISASMIPSKITIQITDNNLQDWALPLIGAFESTLENCEKYAQAHAVALKNGANFHHFSGYLQEKPVASITLSLHEGLSRIDDLGVSPDCQRKGYATALMHYALKSANKLGATHVFLEASAEGLPLYQKLGFTPLFTNHIFSKKV